MNEFDPSLLFLSIEWGQNIKDIISNIIITKNLWSYPEFHATTFSHSSSTKRIKISLYKFGSIIPLKVDIRYSRSGLFVQRLRKYVDFSNHFCVAGAVNLMWIRFLYFKGTDFVCYIHEFSKENSKWGVQNPSNLNPLLNRFFFLYCHAIKMCFLILCLTGNSYPKSKNWMISNRFFNGRVVFWV